MVVAWLATAAAPLVGGAPTGTLGVRGAAGGRRIGGSAGRVVETAVGAADVGGMTASVVPSRPADAVSTSPVTSPDASRPRSARRVGAGESSGVTRLRYNAIAAVYSSPQPRESGEPG